MGFLQKAADNITIINRTEQIDVRGDDAVGEVASQAANAVVTIVSTDTAKGATVQVDNKAVKPSSSVGVGVVATSDGVIVTYRSAIRENDAAYTVFFHDGSLHDAQLLAVDEFTNLAYLKTEAANLTAIAFANSNDYHPGRRLIAIGKSEGEYQKRYATGILSVEDKSFNLAGKALASTGKYEGVSRVDFANQDEYVGGPVIGYNGQLVGIMGALSIDGKNEYFQIPSNAVKDSLDLAVRGELGSRPYLGMYYMPLSKQSALLYNLDTDRGALVYTPSGKQGLAIIAGSPAERAGIKIWDVITAVDGQAINLDNPFSNLIGRHKRGETVVLTVLRDGGEFSLDVAL